MKLSCRSYPGGDAGCAPLALGPRVLRTETAGLAALG